MGDDRLSLAKEDARTGSDGIGCPIGPENAQAARDEFNRTITWQNLFKLFKIFGQVK